MNTPLTSNDVFLKAIEDNLFSAWAHLARLPQVDYRDEPESVRFLGGIPFPLCNSVMRADLAEAEIDGKIEETLSPFRERELPMFWWIGPATRPADLGSRLERHGLRYMDEAVGMAADLAADLPGGGGDPTVRIREVVDEKTLREWMDVFRVVFEVPEFVADFFAAAMRCVGFGSGSAYRHFIGDANGASASCSSLLFDGDVAGTYNVATLADFRSRGIGAAMSRAAMVEARERGCRLSVLHATPMGYPVYRKLGYREFCRIKIYSNVDNPHD